MEYAVKVFPAEGCPGVYEFGVRLTAKGKIVKSSLRNPVPKCTGCNTRCSGTKEDLLASYCQTPFQSGCKSLSGEKDKFTANKQEPKVVGKCNEARGYVKIQRMTAAAKAAAAKVIEQQPGKPEEPTIWSNVVVYPGKYFSAGNKAFGLKKIGQAVGAVFGGKGVSEDYEDKLGRVCNKLRTVDDKLVRTGVAAFRFGLLKPLTGKGSELGEVLWKVVKGNGKAYACNVRSNSPDLAKSACKLQLDSASTTSDSESGWDGRAWVHTATSRSLVHSRTWL